MSASVEKLAETRRRLLGHMATGATSGTFATVNAADLSAKHFDPVRWAAPGILPCGVTILAGAPKTGKSWLAMDLAIASASGGVVLGKVQVDPGAALYLALEDNERRLQARLLKRLQGSPAPSSLEFATEWPRIDQGAADRLEEWLSSHPDARLVIIDTIAKIRPPSKAKDGLYESDYAIGAPLLRLAAAHNVAIVLIHHTRKGESDDPLEMVSGSTGLSGGVDNVMVLRRRRGTNEATLFVTGRDIEGETEYGLEWDSLTAGWVVTGQGPHVGLSPERRKVYDVIAAYGPIDGRGIASALHPGTAISRDSREWTATRRLLAKLVEGGLVSNTEQGYCIHSVSSGNTDHTSNTGNTGNTGNTVGCVTGTGGVLPPPGNTLQPSSGAGSEGVCYRVTGVTAVRECFTPGADTEVF